MIAVVNATPLISLAILGHLDLLRQIFTEVIAPTGVYEEVVTRGAGRSGARAVAEARSLRVLC
jgi:hypothetical protein